jgi:hypothetical protein
MIFSRMSLHSFLSAHHSWGSPDIGDLLPGESRQVGVYPEDDSSVEIEFTDKQASRVRTDAVGYLTHGYRGTLHIDLEDGKIRDSDWHDAWIVSFGTKVGKRLFN